MSLEKGLKKFKHRKIHVHILCVGSADMEEEEDSDHDTDVVEEEEEEPEAEAQHLPIPRLGTKQPTMKKLQSSLSAKGNIDSKLDK